MKLANVVCTAALSKRRSSYALLQKNPYATRCTRKFTMLILKRSPTFLVFASGKLVCTGAKSVKSAKRATMQLIQGWDASLKSFKVVNVVGSCRLPFTINRHTLQADGGWLHEHFAGSTFFLKGKSRLIAFTSGAVIITGVQTEEELRSLWNKLYPVLYKHRISFIK